jgi:sugar transferase (PEP-CTERM/EpsH1 system associated)
VGVVRILFVSAPLLFPANTGGRIRSSEILRRLCRRHRITAVCFQTPHDTARSLAEMRGCCEHLELVAWRDAAKFTPRFYAALLASAPSPLPYTVWKYRSQAMRRRLIASAPDHDVIVCDFLQPMVNVPAMLATPVVLFQHNVEAVILQRHIEHTANPLVRTYLRLELAKLARFEARALRRATHTIAVSDVDRDLMASLYGVSNVSVVAGGVDADYWRPGADHEGLDLVFTGSMDWLPNQDAVLYFVRDILPLIRREVPVSFWIVGRNPPGTIRDLERSAPGVKVTGTVDDVRPWVQRAAVYVVPLRIGGGTRIKILEAMAMAKCVVSTTVGAEGLPVEPGRHLLLADSPAAFASTVVSLLVNDARRRSLGLAARELVVSGLTWDAAADRFAAICERVVDTGRTARAACA